MDARNELKGKRGLVRLLNATRYSLAGYKAAWQDEEAFRQICLLAVIGLPLACWLGRDWAESVLLAVPLVLCLALLSIVGVISFTVLSVKNNTVYYSCFLLCGGTRRDCIRLSVFNLCWIALFGLLITLFVTGLFINAGVFDGWYQVTAANVCISLGLGACVPLLGWLVTVLLFKNKTNLQLLKAEA